jgi:hypothetical protein
LLAVASTLHKKTKSRTMAAAHREKKKEWGEWGERWRRDE